MLTIYWCKWRLWNTSNCLFQYAENKADFNITMDGCKLFLKWNKTIFTYCHVRYNLQLNMWYPVNRLQHQMINRLEKIFLKWHLYLRYKNKCELIFSLGYNQTDGFINSSWKFKIKAVINYHEKAFFLY